MSKKVRTFTKGKMDDGKADIFGAMMKMEKQNTDIFTVKHIMRQNRS